MRSERLFEIVFILLNKNQTTAQELAEKFDVSVRTIYRDIDILSSAGIPVYTMKGTGGGIFIDEQYTINKSILTKEEHITKNTNGSYTLNAALPFDSWVCGFILSLGTEVEILEPENLKTEIACLAEKIMKHHRKV